MSNDSQSPPRRPTDSLIPWGWSDEWTGKWSIAIANLKSPDDSFQPARVLVEQRDYMEVITESGPARAEIKGRLRKHGDIQPTVGDWVVLDSNGQIEDVLPRRTCLRRKAAGESEDIQILAANIDWVFITTSMNKDFNPKRIERFLVAARDSLAKVALVFTKADLGVLDIEQAKVELQDRLNGIEVITTSSRTGEGVAALRKLIGPSESAVFLGTSGVGKSSLVNSLLESETQLVNESRADDDKGRHTTTGRQSFSIPGGGIIMDSPGIRELQLADGTVNVDEEFKEIEEISLRCKFTNCRHENEKGCAIRTALSDGSLSQDRLDSYRKLRAEVEAKARRKR